jgi:hypothetical protein
VRVSTEIENAFAGAVALSAADGGYSLEPLASGACELVAEGGEHGRTRASFVLAAGQEQRWDPTFDASRAIRGRVVAQGEALDGWTVRGYAPPGSNGEPPFVAEVTTGARGEFELTAVPERGVDVLLFGRGGTPFPVARRTGVTPGASELVLRPDPELAPSARIVGQLVDAAGSAVRNADVRALHETLGGTLVHPDAEGGTFAIGPLPPGEWTLEVDAHAAGWGVARATRHLAADETWDVGALPLGEGGTLAVSLVREATSAPATLALEIRDAHGRTVDWLTLEGDDVRSRPLAPGEYEIVSLADATLEPARRSFAIVGGQETRVELRAKP